MIPYIKWGIKPSIYILELKRMEAIHGLLIIDERFYPYLFDFIFLRKTNLIKCLNNKNLNQENN